jgi:phosphoribosylaminoimidazolecarboxamide formyltransferase/IMP cyclohydrolase
MRMRPFQIEPEDPSIMHIRRALLSVSDKTGLVDLARGLTAYGIELLSTGGTARALRDAGLAVTEVAEVTGFPEMLDGRVKTLHPRIHGGLLAIRNDPNHEAQLRAESIRPIDLLVVSLYPFEATLAAPATTVAEAIEQIDIGGPAMLRSAAKNFEGVAVVVDPADYARLLQELADRAGALTRATRLRLARKAFAHVARYDMAIAGFFDRLPEDADLAAPLAAVAPPAGFPALLDLRLEKLQDLRYGENPHQQAALYRDLAARGGLAAARQLHGKELSYNNLLDLSAAWNLVGEFDAPVAAIIKHNNPCGVAAGARLVDAYVRARDTDPVSAFGGIIAVNRTVDAAVAEAIAATFVEAVIAPAYADDALALLRTKKNLRLIELSSAMSHEPSAMNYEVRQISGGMLVQSRDAADLIPDDLKIVSRRAPSPAEDAALRFAWRVAKHVKSNAIVLADATGTVGIGAGQMSRVDSVRLAIQKACLPTQGTVLASDAFFPFRDGVDEAAQAGITAVIQPGGSLRDAEAIAAADAHGMAMLCTGMRHFRH